jgi:hypothetical protein
MGMRRRIPSDHHCEDKALAPPLFLRIEERSNAAQKLRDVSGLMRKKILIGRRLESARVHAMLFPKTFYYRRFVAYDRRRSEKSVPACQSLSGSYGFRATTRSSPDRSAAFQNTSTISRSV